MFIQPTPGVYAVYNIRDSKASLQLSKSKHGTARDAAEEALVYANRYIEAGDLLFCAKINDDRAINSNGEKCLFKVGTPLQPKLALLD